MLVAWFGTIRQLLARFGMIWHGFAYADFFIAVLPLIQLSRFEISAPAGDGAATFRFHSRAGDEGFWAADGGK
jgi:hypothetical protein